MQDTPYRINTVLRKIITPLMNKFGYIESNLIVYWPDIMGKDLAEITTPKKIRYVNGNVVLYIKVTGGGNALNIQHTLPLLIERIARFFGYKAIHEIRLIQCF